MSEIQTYKVHETSLIGKNAIIGKGSRIWQFCNIMDGVQIGAVSYTHLDVYKRQVGILEKEERSIILASELLEPCGFQLLYRALLRLTVRREQ